jgi:chlorite dismutase
MPDAPERSLNHFARYAFTPAYWSLDAAGQERFHTELLAGLRRAAPAVHLYQLFPAEAGADLLVWCARPAGAAKDPAAFFEDYARALNPWRSLLGPVGMLWGLTGASSYSKARSTQEIDPFTAERCRYLVVYPFVKTTEWYLLGADARQGMMNEHIRVGKQFSAITQLLLYSFGLQNQEFVVVYETDDLAAFSDLVRQLRATDGRAYTERDTPLHTGVHLPAEQALALWRPA